MDSRIRVKAITIEKIEEVSLEAGVVHYCKDCESTYTGDTRTHCPMGHEFKVIGFIESN